LFIDPLGLTIKFCGTVSEREQMFKAVERLRRKSNRARKLIETLEKTKKVYRMSLTKAGNRYNMIQDTIYFNPKKQRIGPKPWQKRPPEVGLAHEMIHAVHDIHDELVNFVKKYGVMEEERRTVGLGIYSKEYFTENVIRKEYGLSRRPRY
jgi:type VI secretion system secreted protein VgrG